MGPALSVAIPLAEAALPFVPLAGAAISVPVAALIAWRHFNARPRPNNDTVCAIEVHLEAVGREEEEAHQKAEDAFRNEEKTPMEADTAEAAREKEQLENALNYGIQPVVWPTAEELAAAKARAGYCDDRLHFAVCGASGVGKSSFINALRGLKNYDEGAAKAAVVECTEALQRCPDLREKMPYPRFVWYDIPGAGTPKIPGWQYFNSQGLFIFDFVILVYERFTQIDADILENCRRYKIPAFIVRSKANQHINNILMNDDEGLGYAQARDKFIADTRRDLEANLRRYNLWKEPDPLPLRIVSNVTLYDFIKDSEEYEIERETGIQLPAEKRKGGKKRAEYIHEPELVNDLLKTAHERRYGEVLTPPHDSGVYPGPGGFI